MNALQRHNQLTERVKSERKITHEVLQDILVMESLRDYAELGYPSMFEYLVSGQKYSEGSAQRRLSAARLLKDVPEIQPMLQTGGLNLTQLVKLSIAVKQEQKTTGEKVSILEKKEILKKLENKSGVETERLLSQELCYTPKVTEKVTPKDDSYYVTLKLTDAQFEKLKKIQSLFSHSNHNGDLAEVLEYLCDKLLPKEKPVPSPKIVDEGSTSSNRKNNSSNINRQIATKQVQTFTATTAVNWQVKSRAAREYIPVAFKKEVYSKAQHCCEYISASTGVRCGATYQLQIDHKVPLAKGGRNDVQNLRLLCRTHNLAEARRWGLSRFS